MACKEKIETDLDMCLATPNGDRRNSIPLPRIIFTRPAVSPCEDSQMSPSEPVNYVTVDTTKFLGTAIAPNAVLVWCPRVVEMTSSEFPTSPSAEVKEISITRKCPLETHGTLWSMERSLLLDLQPCVGTRELDANT